ncbi:MAG: hypothetical protein IPO53_09750 [Chitinophagaceae bacterium]|nr:hypothetical protein [Chitinophagaceae bacterium]
MKKIINSLLFIFCIYIASAQKPSFTGVNGTTPAGSNPDKKPGIQPERPRVREKMNLAKPGLNMKRRIWMP